jgi:hypothetical protein
MRTPKVIIFFASLVLVTSLHALAVQPVSAEVRTLALVPTSPPVEPPTPPTPPTRTPGEFNYRNPLGNVSLNELLGRIIRTALGFVGALFLVMFIYGGATWMTAGGDAEKVTGGRKILINALIGIVIVAISYSVISIIFETAGVIRGA